MKIGTQSPWVAAAVGSHCEASVIFAGSDFDLRLAFDLHGLLETAIRQPRRLIRTRRARENGGKYLLLAATAADGETKLSAIRARSEMVRIGKFMQDGSPIVFLCRGRQAPWPN